MKKRIIKSKKIKEAIVDLLHQASFSLPEGVKLSLEKLKRKEKNSLAQETLKVILNNNEIASQEKIPLCQDCGLALLFFEIGQQACLEGEDLSLVANQAVQEAYQKFYLRKSVVRDPLKRVNTMTNTPAIIHTDLVEGDHFKILVYLKGGGSENMTALKMFKPTDSVEAIISFAKETVREAGPNPCPPLFLGIGLGGTADLALLNSKKAVCRGVAINHSNPYYHKLEIKIAKELNLIGVGPLGLGGQGTVARVFIKEAPTHLATLPVALNLNCHSLRYREIIL